MPLVTVAESIAGSDKLLARFAKLLDGLSGFGRWQIFGLWVGILFVLSARAVLTNEYYR